MDNDYKTKFVGPQQTVAVADVEQPPDELAAKALEEIHSAERLSGFGRFAMKLQTFFQAPKASQPRQGLSHLKIAPILMSAGLLLLFATGLLFLLSKPESAVPSHFRQPTVLAGSDGQKNTATAPTESPVTEDQLAGRDVNTDAGVTNSSKKQGVENSPPHRFAFSDSEREDANQPAQLDAQSRSSALATPATVFIAESAADALLKKDMGMQSSAQPAPQVPGGTEIVAHTTNAISSGLESPVVAVVDRAVRLGDAVVIPEGAHVIGHTAGTVKDRVNVRFTSVVLPHDREMPISGLALMKDGSAGLVGKVKGTGHPFRAGAARIGTGAAVVATEFAGQGSLNQPFSQADYLRNQMAAEVASQGSQLSNRWQQPTSVPIVAVDANQAISIFLLEPLTIAGKPILSATPARQLGPPITTAGRTQPSEQDLVAAQTAYIQALEAQLAEVRSANEKKPN